MESAMGYGELDKKVDVFYEKLLAKCTNYAIINFDRRKPSKSAQRVRQKTVPSNTNRSFSADTGALSRRKERMPRRIERAGRECSCAG